MTATGAATADMTRRNEDLARRARAFDAAWRRSVFVRRLRLGLLALAALIALNALIQIVISDAGELAEAPAAPGGDAERIVNPRFTGRDETGAPYVVTAETASRRARGAGGLTDLIRPVLDYGLLRADGADPSQVLARAGIYDAEARVLELQNAVRFATRSGYRFSTERARIHLSEARISGDAPVEGAAPWGRIRAGGFDVTDGGERVVFTGGVRTRIFTEDAGPESADPAATEDLP